MAEREVPVIRGDGQRIVIEGAELSQIPVYKPLQLTDEMKEKLSKKIHEVFYSDPVYIESDGTTSEGNNTAELIQSWYENRRD
ncbi:hypothetical protein ABEW81_11230 [Priestia megaterium]